MTEAAPETLTELSSPPATEPGFLPGDMNRRSFMVRAGAAAAVAGAAGALGPVGSAIAAPAAPRRLRSSSASPLPSAASVLADERPLTDHEVMELAA
ncbi:MAG TPA: hypothetical protein VHA80_00300, partial [Solirubrobacterales bacterium]|nr:hypothetical protein [Solirubrobacterales bacterium]